jgi:hypothetical protein
MNLNDLVTESDDQTMTLYSREAGTKFFDYINYLSSIHYHVESDSVVTPGAWVAAGCSHTVGVGIETNDNYCSQLGRRYEKTIHNIAIGMGNHQITRSNIQLWLRMHPDTGLIIAQWPGAIRLTTWDSEKLGQRVSISQNDSILHEMLRRSEINFDIPWLDSIITLNQLSTALNIPIVNIMLGDCAPEYLTLLNKFNINLHIDEKKEGRSWIFDNAASDGSHHSKHCHKLWADRLARIISNELGIYP